MLFNYIRNAAVAMLLFGACSTHATLIQFTSCTGTNLVGCVITNSPPTTVNQNPDDGILLAWDEVQNFTLTQDLFVDRVFDPNASFVEAVTGGFILKEGTIVSSHYIQWDPLAVNGSGTSGSVQATLQLDSQIFAFITADQKLFDSDFLGVPGVNYNDFGLRGFESGDITTFNGNSVDIDLFASSPGDWARLITAFSPAAVPEPDLLFPMCFASIFLWLRRRKIAIT